MHTFENNFIYVQYDDSFFGKYFTTQEYLKMEKEDQVRSDLILKVFDTFFFKPMCIFSGIFLTASKSTCQAVVAVYSSKPCSIVFEPLFQNKQQKNVLHIFKPQQEEEFGRLLVNAPSLFVDLIMSAHNQVENTRITNKKLPLGGNILTRIDELPISNVFSTYNIFQFTSDTFLKNNHRLILVRKPIFVLITIYVVQNIKIVHFFKKVKNYFVNEERVNEKNIIKKLELNIGNYDLNVNELTKKLRLQISGIVIPPELRFWAWIFQLLRSIEIERLKKEIKKLKRRLGFSDLSLILLFFLMALINLVIFNDLLNLQNTRNLYFAYYEKFLQGCGVIFQLLETLHYKYKKCYKKNCSRKERLEIKNMFEYLIKAIDALMEVAVQH